MDKAYKVLLIFPPVTRPEDFSADRVRVSPFLPLGLAYLGAAIERESGFEVQILDALIEGQLNGVEYGGNRIRYGFSDDEIIARIEAYKPDLVGISCTFSAMEWDSINLCTLAKQVNPEIITVMGGPHAGANERRILERGSDCDYVIIGEGEVTFLELLRGIVAGKPNPEAINGIAFRNGADIVVNPKTRYIEELDTVAQPARHLLKMDRYFEFALPHSVFKNKPFTQVVSSRGCPAKCTFCAINGHWGKIQRKRSAENVLAELESLVRDYGVREIHFEDDNLTADKRRAIKIFDGIIERKLDITWTCPSGMAVNALDQDILQKMKASGCYSVSLAIESGNQDVVTRIMRKPVDLKKVPPLVQTIRELDMEVRGFFILGYPGETKENMRETIDFARSLDLDWAHFFIFSPLPGTDIYETCIEKGYMKVEDFDPLRSFHQPVIHTPEFDHAYLQDIREEAIIDVNFENNCNLRKYNVDKAIASFSSVINLYPHFDFAHYYLGEAYLKKGMKDAAKQCFERVLEITPSHPKARTKLAELEELT